MSAVHSRLSSLCLCASSYKDFGGHVNARPRKGTYIPACTQRAK